MQVSKDKIRLDTLLMQMHRLIHLAYVQNVRAPFAVVQLRRNL